MFSDLFSFIECLTSSLNLRPYGIDFNILYSDPSLTYFGHKDLVEYDVGVLCYRNDVDPYKFKDISLIILEFDKQKETSKIYTELLTPKRPILIRLAKEYYTHHRNIVKLDEEERFKIIYKDVKNFSGRASLLKILIPRIYSLIWYIYLTYSSHYIDELKKILFKSIENGMDLGDVNEYLNPVSNYFKISGRYFRHLIGKDNLGELICDFCSVSESKFNEDLDKLFQNIVENAGERILILVLPQFGLNIKERKYQKDFKQMIINILNLFIQDMEIKGSIEVSTIYSREDLKEVCEDLLREVNDRLSIPIQGPYYINNKEEYDRLLGEFDKHDSIVMIYQDFSKGTLFEMIKEVFKRGKKLIYIPIQETMFLIDKSNSKNSVERITISRNPYGKYRGDELIHKYSNTLYDGFIEPLFHKGGE